MFWNKQKNRKGLLELSFIGSGLLNKGIEFDGPWEVEIVGETDDMFKVYFLDSTLDSYNGTHWFDKKLVKLFKDDN